LSKTGLGPVNNAHPVTSAKATPRTAPTTTSVGTGGDALSRVASSPLSEKSGAVFSALQTPTTPQPPPTSVGVGTFDAEDEMAAQQGLGLRTNVNIRMHRNNLIEALRNPRGIDVAQAEKSLQVLVAENKACGQGTPEQSRLYMGFDDLPHVPNNRALMARQLHQAAGPLWEKLQDTECKQMLDWIGRDWKNYERSSTVRGSRLSMYRMQKEAPIQQDAKRELKTVQSDNKTLKTAAAVMEREALCKALSTALISQNTPTVKAILKGISSRFDPLDLYLPLAWSLDLAVCTAVHEGAVAYAATHNTASSERLVRFAADNLGHAHAVARVELDQQDFTAEELDEAYPPEVRELCMAMRDTTAAQMHADAHSFLGLITDALRQPDLSREIAQQPYANLRTMLLKCTVLEETIDPDTVGQLRDAIEEAVLFQSNVSRHLRAQLLADAYDESEIRTLAMLEYAKETTTLPIDYVSAGASWADIDAMRTAIQDTYKHYMKKGEDYRVDQAALQWVLEKITATSRKTR